MHDKTGDLVSYRGCRPIGRYIGRVSVDISVDISAECQSSIDRVRSIIGRVYRFEYRSSVNRVFASNARLRTVACSALRTLFWIILRKKGVWLWGSFFWFEINFLFYRRVRPSFNSATREVKLCKLMVKRRRDGPPSFFSAWKKKNKKQETARSLCEA